jgi:hypothetical protein
LNYSLEATQVIIKKMNNLLTKGFFITILMCCILSFQAKSWEYYGGEITYTCVGLDSFIVDLTLYNDCNSWPLTSNYIKVSCTSNGSTIANIGLTAPTPIDVTPVCANSCTRCQSFGCSFPYGIEKYVYSTLVVISNAGSCCDIRFSFSGSSRSLQINTGVSGVFYIESTLNRCILPQNSSPKFLADPLTISCIGQDLQYNPRLLETDKDASGLKTDSLSYEWTQPLASSIFPLSYSGQYTYQRPIYFWGFPNTNLPSPRGFHLDPYLGNISFRPMKIQQTVMVLKIKEWRKDSLGVMKKIGSITRDMRVIVLNCPNNEAPRLDGPYYKEICAGDTAIFIIHANDYNDDDSITLSGGQEISQAEFTVYNQHTKSPIAFIKIPTSINDISPIPLIFSLEAKDNACPVPGKSIHSYQLLVKNPDTTNNPLVVSKQFLGCGRYSFNIQNPDPGLQYTWTFLDSKQFTIIGTNADHTFGRSNDYHIFVETNSNYCKKYTHDTFMLQHRPVFVSLPDSIHTYPNNLRYITADITNYSNTVTYKWNDGDSTHLVKPIIYQPNINSEIVSIQVHDTNNCSDSAFTIVYHCNAIIDAGPDLIECAQNTQTKRIYGNAQVFHNLQITSYSWWKLGQSYPISNLYYANLNDSGTYIFAVTLNNGDTLFDTMKYENYPDPISQQQFGNDTTLCGKILTYPLYPNDTSLQTTWAGNGVFKNGDQYYIDLQSPNIQYGQNNNYDIFYTDSLGCSYSKTRKIRISKSPDKPEVGPYGPYCLKNTLINLGDSLKGTFTGPGILYEKYFNPEIAGSGTHEIIYSIGDSLCEEYDTVNIIVHSKPKISLQTKSGKHIFCANSGLKELVFSPPGGILYGDVSNKKYFNTDTVQGDYRVTYTYQDSNFCSFQETLILSIGEAELKFLDPLKQCYDDFISLRAYTSTQNEINWYSKDSADGSFFFDSLLDCTCYKPGIIDKEKNSVLIYMTSYDSICGLLKDSIEMEIYQNPEVEFRADKPYFKGSNVGYDVEFYNMTSNEDGKIVKYEWNCGYGPTFEIFEPQFNFRYKYNGYWTVSLFALNSFGCNDRMTKSDYIYINPGSNNIINLPKESIQIFPNPSDQEVFIQSEAIIYSIKLWNALGKLVIKEVIETKEYRIPYQKPGMYFLELTDKHNHAYQRKVIFY